jgi:hypothetical protein
MIGRAGIKLVDVAGIEPATPCLQKQKVKLHKAKLSEKELDGEEDPAN